MDVFHKVRMSDFVILDPSAPCTCIYDFRPQSFPLVECMDIFFSQEDVPEICFVNYYQSKATLQNKQTTVKMYQKMSNQNTKKSPEGSKLRYLTVSEGWE